MKIKTENWQNAAKYVIIIFTLCFFFFSGRISIRLGHADLQPQADTTVYVDTVPFYYPVPRDSVVLRYTTVKLPVSNGETIDNNSAENIPDSCNNDIKNIPDSVDVTIPITQKIYSDSSYKAYVSGYMTSLDSIFVYPHNRIIRSKPKRWSLGIGAGYGIGKNGLSPTLSLSLQYKLWEF